jgi:hypothetical protein
VCLLKLDLLTLDRVGLAGLDLPETLGLLAVPCEECRDLFRTCPNRRYGSVESDLFQGLGCEISVSLSKRTQDLEDRLVHTGILAEMRNLLRQLRGIKWNRRSAFQGSREYWERRYAGGGDSGKGSYGEYAAEKARFLNAFVAEHGVDSVIEFGCGDGSQLSLATYPSYLGLDVSQAAVARCRARFASDGSKEFMLVDDYAGQQADLSLSLDVVYHLVEDAVFDRHMRQLFAAGRRYVIVYSTNTDKESRGAHVRHRRFTDWVERNQRGWELTQHASGPAPSSPSAEFYVFTRCP